MNSILRACVLLFICGLLFGQSTTPEEQAACVYNSDCRPNECAIADIRGGQKCIPKEYVVAIFDQSCVKSVDWSNAQVEAPLEQDSPSLDSAKIIGAKVTIKTGCPFHKETRSR